MSPLYTAIDHLAALPAILLIVFGCAAMLMEVLIRRPRERFWIVAVTLAGLVFTGWALWKQQRYLALNGLPRFTAFHGALTIDGFSLFFNAIFLVTSFLVALISYRYLEIEGEHRGEYYGLLLLAQAGMYFLATGTDLITLFLGTELMAICFYVMVGFLRRDKRSNEAALKYFLLGGFSSAFLVYGFSLLYGIAGSTLLTDVAQAVAARGPSDPIVFLALATTIVGLLFKISAVPFHMWTPDAYEGAPTSVTAYLSVGSKAASLAFLLRILLGPLAPARSLWEPLIVAVSVASIVIGSLAALSQNNLKRLIAYSAVSHAGYILLGIVAGNDTGYAGIAVYILVYTFMNLGALLVVVAMRRNGILGEDMDQIAGLAQRSPAFAVFMAIFLLSLAGIPPTAGFLGKYYIFLSLIETAHYALAILAALYVAVSLYFYFRIVQSMFMHKMSGPEPIASSAGMRVALGITGALTLGIGIFPEPFLQFARTSLLR